MMLRTLLILLLSFFVLSVSSGQVKYDRSSLTVLSLENKDFRTKAISEELHKLVSPEKFFNTPAENRYITPDIRRVNPVDYLQNIEHDTIIEWFSDHKIPQKVLSVWFNRQPDGSFNIDTIRKRGMYNASDNEFMIATSSKRGIASLMDEGLKLVDQSYILLFDFYNIASFEEFYNYNKTKKKDRDQVGYMANAKIYVLKLVFDDEVASSFFNDFWISQEEVDKTAKKASFENHRFSFVPVSMTQTRLQASQSAKRFLGIGKRKSDEEFFREIAQSALNSALANLEVSASDVQVKAMISTVRPIGAKIGKKEDLKFENRYFVYENQLDKRGNQIAKRVGVVKAYKIIDNREIASGTTQPSLFYQIAGKKIDNQGMYLISRNNLGFNVSGGFSIGGKEGFTAKAEYYISKNLGRLVGSGRSGKLLTSISLYTELGFHKDSRFATGKISYSTWTFGLGKSLYLSRNFHATPFGGIGFESASWESLYGGSVSEPRMEYGVLAGINLRHNFQLMTGLSKIDAFGQATLRDADGNTTGNYYGTAFDGRDGMSFSLGFRMMF